LAQLLQEPELKPYRSPAKEAHTDNFFRKLDP